MAAPTNITPETAMVLTMPYSAPLDVSEVIGHSHRVWFTYEAVAADIVIGFAALADPASNYIPVTTVYSGSPTSLTTLMSFVINRPLQYPVTTGTQYYFEVANSGVGDPLTAPLELNLVRAPNDPVPAGALLINDDTVGFPLAVLSPTDGSIQQYRSFPAGETGEMLPSGLSLWHDRAGPALRLYDAALSLVGTPTWTFEGEPRLSSNRQDQFYVSDDGTAAVGPVRVTTISPTGSMGSQTWTLSPTPVSIAAIAVSRDDAVLYYYQVVGTSSEIRRWDLGTDLPLTSLAPAVPGYLSRKSLLVLADDSVLVGYTSTPAPPYDSFLRRYSPDGTLLATYPLGGILLNKFTYAPDDPASFWTWSFLVGAGIGYSRFQRIQVSDGVVVSSFDAVRAQQGILQSAAGILPDMPFGHSNSCPLVVMLSPLPPEPPDGGGGGDGGPEPPYGSPAYDLDERIIRRLRRAPHLSNEHKRVFYRRFELDLERGVGLATGQGEEPHVMLRLSRDGGATWSEPLLLQAGRLGEYLARAQAHRLGHGRDVVFEVTVSDPVAWALVGAWLELEPGTH